MATNPEMKNRIARWYKPLEMGADGKTQDARTEGVAALVAQTTRSNLESLIRLTFKSRQQPTAEEIQRIRACFKSTDENFAMYGNERELQLLAAATIAEIVGGTGQLASLVALAVSTSRTGREAVADLPLNLTEAAESEINRLSLESRTRPKLSHGAKVDFPRAEFDKSIEKIKGQQDFAGCISAMQLMVEAAQLAHTRLLTHCNERLTSAADIARIQDEELQILWWLFGERCWDLDCRFCDLPDDRKPFVLANELAAFSALPPGPPALKSLLARAGVQENRETTLVSCINACDEVWLRQVVGSTDCSPVTAPIHFGIQRKLETGDTASWVPGWVAIAGLDPATRFSANRIAVQFFRERLLRRGG